MSFTIETGKETGLVQANVIPKPLILCALAAINPATKLVDSGSDVTYLTTTPALGGQTLTYNGNVYEARLQGNPIEQIQAQSPQGYDIPGSISLVIADGDFTIWGLHANAFGWRGGTLTVTFVLWDIPTGAYSTNAYRWTFILDKPTVDFGAGVIKVTGQARQSMTRQMVPNFARQNRCGNTFPGGTGATRAAASTAAALARRDGLTNPTSMYFGCAYSPDLVSIGGVGNIGTPNLDNPDGSFLTDASGYYLMCDYTRSCGAGKASLTQGCMRRLGNTASTTTFGSGGKPCGPDGDIAHDEGNRATGHFTGDTWVAPLGWKGNQYDSPTGEKYGFNAPNAPTGSTYYNQGYGTQWVNATVLAPFSGANALVAECVVCMAPNGPAKIIKVLVGGVEVPFNNDPLQDFTYAILSGGGRTGVVTQLAVIKGQGDPHGSMCWIVITVPVELAASGSIPTVQVLVQFPQCLHAYPVATAVASGGNTILTLVAGVGNNYNAGVNAGQAFSLSGNSGVPNGTYTASSVTQTVSPVTGTITIPGAWNGTGGSIFYYPSAPSDDGFSDVVPSTGGNPTIAVAANPVWALMDLLACWGPFTALDIDAASWYAAAQICAVQIAFTDINNNAGTHARFRCSLALITSQRQSLAKAVLAIRNCACIILARDPISGLIQCFIEQTLADQQSAPIPGSNYNTAVASMPATSTTLVPSSGTPGYLAYLFDGGSATVAPSIEKGTFKLSGRTLNDTPNTISFPFQDEANGFVQDTITTIDPEGYVTSGNQEIPASFAVMGPDNFDQGTRIPAVVSVTALRDLQDTIIGYLLIGTDNTARKRAEEEVLKAGALQRAIFNSANFSSIATDAKGIIQIFNVGAERMLGYTAAEMMNRITPADISDPQEVIARAGALSLELGTRITPGFEALVFKASRGIEDIYELTYVRKDGSRFPAVVSVTALRDLQDTIIGYLLIGTDNTARKRAEEELLKAGALQRAIFNSANFSSIATDAKGIIQIFNVGAERMLGYTAAEVMNKITPADISDAQEVIARAQALSLELKTPITPGFEALVFKASHGIEDIYELTYVRKDGSRFPAVVSVTALRDLEGAIIGYLLIGTDNTARQKADEALRKSEAQLHTILENLDEGVTLCDLNGKLVYCNGAARKLHPHARLDQRPETETARTFELLGTDGTVLTEDEWPLERILRGEKLRGVEVSTWRSGAGWQRVFSCSGTLVQDAGGQPLMAVLTVTDVTERRRAADVIRQLNIDLEQRVGERTTELQTANNELEAFCYSVSHDLRAPLRSLDGFSQALLEDYADRLDAKGQNYLGRIRINSQRMGQLIDDLLNLSRISRTELRKELVDLSRMAREVAEELRATDPPRDAEFVVPDGLIVETDPRMLRIVLTNLFGNAWKFTAKRPHALIEFGSAGENGAKEYFTKDNGAGFDQEYSGKLFGAFQRLHSSTEFPGTGIGLATVQRIIHRQGGRVWAEGKVEQGATFHFTL